MSEEEIQEEEEELNDIIADQDLSDGSVDTLVKIKDDSKVFPNEKIAIKILLSKHYSQFREIFFKNIKKNKTGVHGEIEKQIQNILNNYMSKIDKEKDGKISNELYELIILLKGYYNQKDFDKNFFVNYFKYIREMNRIKEEKITYPKNAKETLNDIERKVKIIKDLNHYLTTQIIDRMEIKFDSKYSNFNDPYLELEFNYLVIEEDEFLKMDEIELQNYISENGTSNVLRRPLSNNILYNYLPILCEGSCLKEAEFFNNEFEKWIINHINNGGCQKLKCVEIRENLDNIKSQIRSLYIKTCIFSHNINEIMFHPLNLFTMSSFEQFYKNQLTQIQNENIPNFVRKNNLSKK